MRFCGPVVVSEAFGVAIGRGVSHRGLLIASVLSRPLGQVMPCWASTIRLWLNTASPIAP
jgi:hypothetical protein